VRPTITAVPDPCSLRRRAARRRAPRPTEPQLEEFHPQESGHQRFTGSPALESPSLATERVLPRLLGEHDLFDRSASHQRGIGVFAVAVTFADAIHLLEVEVDCDIPAVNNVLTLELGRRKPEQRNGSATRGL
jgi:hypothetical protein